MKNRYVQLFVRLIILGIFVWGACLSLGVREPHPVWFVYYTNLSNYFCLLIVLAEVICNIASLSNGEKSGKKDVPPALKFCSLIAITVTFIVLNFVLDTPFRAEYWHFPENVLMHMVNPLIFWLDWILFAKHGTTKWTYPLYSAIFPFLYVSYIFIRASVIGGVVGADGSNATTIVYPYFFLNVANLGIGGVVGWIAILLAGFLIIGYLIYILDSIKKIKERHAYKKEQF